MRPTLPLALAAVAALAGCDDATSAPQDTAPHASDVDASDAATSDADTSEDAIGEDAPGRDTDDDADASPDVPEGCAFAGTPGATARCLTPQHPPAYYVAEASAYFDTLDVDADRESVPNYAENVARWEWPPWLLLTALGRDDMIQTSTALRSADPSTVPERDCRFFDVQPFARCYIVFDYEGERCPIYEEFTFNDAGETTFIEAWSDQPGMLPMDRDADPWAEAPDVSRLATRIPGLGNATGSFLLAGDAMATVSETDEDVADFALRSTNWWSFWFEEVAAAGTDYFDVGCGWTE